MEHRLTKPTIFQRYQNSYFAYFLMYNFYFLSWALFSTLISVYLLDLGFRASQVSMVVSVSFLASMVTQPFIGYLNDRFDSRFVTTILLGVTILGSLLMMSARNIWWITLAHSLVLLIVNGTVPIMEKLAVSSPFSYGKIRIWGTIGFALGTQISGFIYDAISPQAIFMAFILTMILTILGTLGTEKSQKQGPSTKGEDGKKVGLRTFLGNREFLGYLLLVFLFSGANNTGHTYIPAMLNQEGMAVGLVTTVISISVICESPVTLFSNRFMDRLTSKTIFTAVIILIGLQYLVYWLPLDLTYKVLVTLLFKHTTGMVFIMLNMKIVNSLVDKAVLITALSLVQTIRSLGSITFQNISGFILDHSSYNALFFFLLMTMVLSFIFLQFLRLPNGNEEALFR